MNDEKASSSSLDYKSAGVDIDAGNALVERIKGVAQRTRRPEVMAGLGGFGALCEIPSGYKNPVLVSGTDGVGTKLKLAMQLQQHDTIGIDLVAMCVNDLIVCGAEPLFFLDYYATGRLNVDMASQVVTGIGEGCQQAGCALVGGETAEMPGMYAGEDYDLAGFCVGIVEKSECIDGSQVKAGDSLIALASSGAHSNGYSLIRKIVAQELEQQNIDLHSKLGEESLANTLLKPTRIYVKTLLSLLKTLPVNAISHITGGGLLENIPRVLPSELHAIIDTNSWKRPPLFDWLQDAGNIQAVDMFRTFNCGVGMVICVSHEYEQQALRFLQNAGETAWVIGSITAEAQPEPLILDGLA